MTVWIVFFVAFLLCKRFVPWFGNLPGDLQIQKENLYVAFPLTSCAMLGVVLSLLLSIIRHF